MNKPEKIDSTRRRALPKKVRREQLIRATMTCIARTGLSGVTMASVTSEAGLSLGIANLHFKSKDKLLLETLKHVTAEYNQGHSAILQGEGNNTTAEKIEALLKFDFSPEVTRKEKLAVWFAFWGEAKSRPTYQRICSQADSAAEDAVGQLFQAAINERGYSGADAGLLSSGYTALIDGLWLDLLVCPRHLKRDKARQVARHYLASAFPDHIAMAP